MLKSMTGFGASEVETNGLLVQVEIKSLNSKYTDIYCKLPKLFSSYEIDIRNILSKSLERGKIEYILNVVYKDEVQSLTSLNKALIKGYINNLKELRKELDFNIEDEALFELALKIPNSQEIQQNEEKIINPEIFEVILEATNKAIEKVTQFRLQEGKATRNLFIEYAQKIENDLNKIIEIEPNRKEQIRNRITKNLEEFVSSDSYDVNRLEQELIYYIEKYDIAEEVERLKNHLKFFIEQVENSVNGKKLNFISQEMGREINTIGSKANDSNIQKFVVEMKENLEKIKEQTMNIV